MGPGAEALLAFLMVSFTSFSVGSETSNGFSGSFAGSIRSQFPSGSSRLGSECVDWRYLSTSSSGASNLPDRSLSSKDLANLYGLAVNAALFFALSLAFLLVFSAFRSDISSNRSVCRSCVSPALSVGELVRYLDVSCLSSCLRFCIRVCRLLGFGGSFRAIPSSNPNLSLPTE